MRSLARKAIPRMLIANTKYKRDMNNYQMIWMMNLILDQRHNTIIRSQLFICWVLVVFVVMVLVIMIVVMLMIMVVIVVMIVVMIM